ncbi:MAG: hypothetical protein HN802_04265 [Candidatus Jacksonbacteria bacterium]|nr:hypothetical protein [Candidatus Jacksonbacteria bacterium]
MPILLKEGSANTHLTHLEELVLTQGPAGYKMARAFLLELLETLKGNSKSHVQTSVKWDGAPAMFVGINPENGKFFVGTKSIFNKVPKINYTEEDIVRNHGHAPGLVDKLTKALKYLPSLGIKNILQGDFMFDDEMLDVVQIDGEPHYRFKPNTIVYAVPVDSDLGREIGQSKFGIVFHTTYDSLDSGASFGADVSALNRPPGIWFDDAFFTDDTGTVTLTAGEEKRILSLVKEADAVNESIDYNNLPSALLNIYINSEIKGGQFLEDPERSFDGFKNWYFERSEKKISKLKSEKGRGKAETKALQDIQLLDSKKEDILNLFQVSRLLFEAKNIFIEKYNNAVYNTKHFVDDGSGDLVATNPEGYVAVDHAGNGVKFVDRLEFSRANFMVDKTAKFTGESVDRRNFTVQISKNKQITKTLGEWLTEIKSAGHKHQKLPQMVYKDVLAGTPIVDIVVQENAERTIYNAVMDYASSLKEQFEEEPPEDEWHSDEYETLGDRKFADTPGQTIALVPGAFKPPHRGHADMVRRYATGDGVPKADRTIILISNPEGAKRTLPHDGSEVSAEHSERIWETVFSDVTNLPGVEVRVADSEMRSPVSIAYEYISETSPLDIKAGDSVILGASRKDRDFMRWKGASEYKKKKRGVNVLAGEEYAVVPSERSDNKPFSASDSRQLVSNLVNNPDDAESLRQLAEYIPQNKINQLFNILGQPSPVSTMEQDPVNETSLGGGGPGGAPGNVTGYSGPLQSGSGNPKKKPRKKKNENLVIVNEVMKLIMERGIQR